MLPLRHAFPGLAIGFAAVLGHVAANATPEMPLTVSKYADEHRHVGAESGSPAPGKWRNAETPYLVEPMDSCQLGNGVRRVVLTGGAQFGKSEVSLNAIAWAITYEPCNIILLLPSIEETRTYSRLKWEPTVKDTPHLRERVHLMKSRTNDGSTSSVKNFRGGSMELVTAGASKALQMRTARVIVAEECAQYDVAKDGSVGVGGDAITAAEGRQETFEPDAKTIYVSTPGFAGRCRITAEYKASDQRRWHTPCPHCGDAFVLDILTLHAHEGRACFLCPSCGCVIEEGDREAMNAAGFWLPTFEHTGESEEQQAKRAANPAPPKIIPAAEIEAYAPYQADRGYRFASRDCEGRARGYHLWQGQSNLSSWQVVLEKKTKFERGEYDAREYAQKVLGEPFEEVVDRPDSETLYEARGIIYPRAGIVPPWAAIVTGFIDVQANRLEWGVWAYGRGGIGARIASGVIAKSPHNIDTWRSDVSALVRSTFAGPRYRERACDYWGVDLGGTATEEVYNFVASHRALNVLALKGSSHDKGMAPAYERGKKIKVKWRGVSTGHSIVPIITGTHGLKTRVYYGLLAGLESAKAKPPAPLPRSLHLPFDATKTDFQQITAEYLKQPDPREKGEWVCPSGTANEQLDIAVGSLALAIMEGLDLLNEESWARRYAERMPALAEIELTPLERLMQDKADSSDGSPEAPAEPVFEPPPAEGTMQDGLTEADLSLAEELGRMFGGHG